ncbi:hypothetical protein IQ247_15070 [Plectonema cf. radiosum LEGE 06105]|uniref:Uncharacterized protein n=1 Tax=Plectonema cf. radiosum LEGE 06105 TaxID=945769 RepID=A0A8J7FHU0_9CYAN|nr:hypothetical protein [Plectonema radiosum]MBE9213971.1 hypothetical protein [Plectonema cf. radiosum LEGE 06105]
MKISDKYLKIDFEIQLFAYSINLASQLHIIIFPNLLANSAQIKLFSKRMMSATSKVAHIADKMGGENQKITKNIAIR